MGMQEIMIINIIMLLFNEIKPDHALRILRYSDGIVIIDKQISTK